MFLFRWIQAPKSRSRQLFACVALVGYLASVTGFPLPESTRSSGNASVPFPCQDHACGCGSAAQCWDDCCCFTLAERVAWARKNNVELPAAVQLAWAKANASPHSGGCCEDHPVPAAKACCTAAVDAPVKKNCGHCPTTEQRETEHSLADSAPIKLRWVHGWQAQKCRGLSTLWVTCGGCLPVPAGPEWNFNWVVCGQLCPTTILCVSHLTPPPVPPPCA